MQRLAIVGGGSWGTALAVVLAPKFDGIRIWVHEEDLVARMNSSRINDVYLPGIRLPANITATGEAAALLEGADIVLTVTPSHHLRRVVTSLRDHLDPDM